MMISRFPRLIFPNDTTPSISETTAGFEEHLHIGYAIPQLDAVVDGRVAAVVGGHFALDDYQTQACQALDAGRDVLVTSEGTTRRGFAIPRGSSMRMPPQSR